MKITVGKVGAIPSRDDPRTLKYSAVHKALIAENALRPPVPHYDNRNKKFQPSSWPILGNDRYGCCTFAAIVRLIMLRSANRGKFLSVRDEDVIKAYLDFNNGQDVGAMPIDVLTWFRNYGVKLSDGTVLKVDTFARCWSLTECRSALQTFGGLYVAASLPKRLDEDRDNRLELTPTEKRTSLDVPGSMGGHAYNIFGGQHREDFAVMWTDDLVEEEDWTNYYRQEAWVFIDNQQPDDTLRKVMNEQLTALKTPH